MIVTRVITAIVLVILQITIIVPVLPVPVLGLLSLVILLPLTLVYYAFLFEYFAMWLFLASIICVIQWFRD